MEKETSVSQWPTRSDQACFLGSLQNGPKCFIRNLEHMICDFFGETQIQGTKCAMSLLQDYFEG